MKPEPEVVELVEYDAVVRELADIYYIMRQSLAEATPQLGAELEALGIGIDKHDVQAVQAAVDEEFGKFLKKFAASLRLPPKAELCCGEFKEGAEYRITNDMSWLRRAFIEAIREVLDDEPEKP
jgi:hypothetical protein